jgi:hypothetical protein
VVTDKLWTALDAASTVSVLSTGLCIWCQFQVI